MLQQYHSTKTKPEKVKGVDISPSHYIEVTSRFHGGFDKHRQRYPRHMTIVDNMRRKQEIHKDIAPFIISIFSSTCTCNVFRKCRIYFLHAGIVTHLCLWLCERCTHMLLVVECILYQIIRSNWLANIRLIIFYMLEIHGVCTPYMHWDIRLISLE